MYKINVAALPSKFKNGEGVKDSNVNFVFLSSLTQPKTRKICNNSVGHLAPYLINKPINLRQLVHVMSVASGEQIFCG